MRSYTTYPHGIAPIIETERLRLRAHRTDDYAAAVALWSDPDVTRYIGGRPFTPEESWGRLLRYVGHWTVLHFGYWAVEEKATGDVIGELGFADYRRDLEPSLVGVPEIGWVFAPRAHGKGYATEGVQAAVAWGDTYLASPQTACLIHPENRPSFRVAEKCGYRELQPAMYRGNPVMIWGRDRQPEKET